MDSRTAARTLSLIAAYLELHGENRFKAKAYVNAARSLVALDAPDLAPLLASGELADTPGLGPATLSVVRDLIDTGESRYLAQLRGEIPEGVLDLLDVPGITPAKARLLHESLGIDSLDALEAAARDGRLAKLPKWGPGTVAKILAGIAFLRSSRVLQLHHRAALAGEQLCASVARRAGVMNATLAGELRRSCEVVGAIVVVAECTDPRAVAKRVASGAGVESVENADTTSPRIRYVDGAILDLVCALPDEFSVALWLATGSPAHVAEVRERLASRGFTVDGFRIAGASGRPVEVPDESALYALAGLPFIPPELREEGSIIARAESSPLPTLIEVADLRGALHCHTTWSDGTCSIADLANGARARGWSYIGVTDHSAAAFYAQGLSAERVIEQHEEIDRLNAEARDGFRILKGIECDILPDGRLDYDELLRERFDFVVASVHSRFSMDEATMTKRVLRALDDPALTVLGHPTGRLLLSRAPYAIDIDAVIEKAAEVGAAIELNADPHRLDLDWRDIPHALARGVTIEIGPDAHSVAGLDNVHVGVAVGRKAMLTKHDVLNTRTADEVLAFARRRR